MTYAEKLKDPRWQRKRLEILNRDSFACRECGDGTLPLHVHHGYYESGLAPWEYPDESLRTVCEECHATRQALELKIKKYLAGLSISQIADALGPDLLTAIQ